VSESVKLNSIISNAGLLIIILIFAGILVPIPFFDSFITTTQLAVYISSTILISFLMITKFWLGLNQTPANKNNQIKKILSSRLVIGFTLIGTISIFTTIFGQSQAIENLFGISGLYAASSLLVVALPMVVFKKNSNFLASILEVTASIVILAVLLNSLGLKVVDFYQQLTPFVSIQESVFIPSGSLLSAWLIIFTATILSFLSRFQINLDHGIFFNLKLNLNLKLWVPWLLLMGLLFSSWSLVKSNFWANTPPLSASVHVAFETAKNIKFFVIGVGPDQVVTYFNQFSPSWIQVTAHAKTYFSQLATVPITIFVTLGFLGFLAWLWLHLEVFLNLKKHYSSSGSNSWSAKYSLALGALLLMGWAIPISITYLILVSLLASFVLIASISKDEKNSKLFLNPNSKLVKLLIKLFLVILILILFLALYFLTQVLLSSFYQLKATQRLDENSLSQALQLQARSIQSNSFNPEYRKAYANNLLEYSSILSQNSNLSESQSREMLLNIQSAINQARAATILQPEDGRHWHSLAIIYRNLIGTINDAETWAIETYVKAIAKQPNNPDLRIELGNILYAKEQYQSALDLFEQALKLNPKNPNAHYNSANALFNLGLTEQAINAYQQALLLLEPDSDLYLMISEEYAARQEQIRE
jgi:tetratricopeptide (TPR) repeat protein